jgi:hypothetical protein
MSKSFFTRLGRTLSLMTTVAVFFASSAWAQLEVDTTHSKVVPFLVNVDATIMAKTGLPCLSLGCCGWEDMQKQITVEADQIANMVFELNELYATAVVLHGVQRQTNVPAIVSNLGGKVTVNLPAHLYKNAEISLYAVSGKRILRNNVSASSAVNSISRPNVATGVYLLSVKGTDGNAVTSRLTHGGGGLNINVAFGNGSENLSAVSQMAKKAYGTWCSNIPWIITVSATVAGYKDSVYTLTPNAGTNALQNIILREESSGDGDYNTSL